MAKIRSINELPSGRGKDPRWEDRLTKLEMKGSDPHEVRQTGIFYLHGKHRVQLANDPKKAFTVQCSAFNPETGNTDRVDAKGKKVKCWGCVAGIRVSKRCVHLFFDEEGQTDKKTGFKPLRDHDAPYGLVDDIQKAGKTNRHTDKKTGEKKAFPTDHPKYGTNIFVTFDKDAEPSKMHTASPGSARPLSKEEMAFAEKNAPDYDALILYPDPDKLKADLIRNEYLNDEGESTGRAEKIRQNQYGDKGGKGGGKGKEAYESEDAKPKGKKLSVKVRDSEESEEGSSEAPAKPGKSKSKSKGSESEASEAPKSKKSRAPVSSEDGSEEGSEEDSEPASSEAPKSKGKSKPDSKSKKTAASSEAGSEDGSEEESEESPKGKSKGKKMPASVDDSEDGSEDGSEEESEEPSEKPAKKKSKK